MPLRLAEPRRRGCRQVVATCTTPHDQPDMRPLSQDLDRADAQPYFIWDIPVTVAELRRHLLDPNPATRALWKARVMREARYQDVWEFLSIDEILADLRLIQRHLGRTHRFWNFLIDGWQRDGLLPGSA